MSKISKNWWLFPGMNIILFMKRMQYSVSFGRNRSGEKTEKQLEMDLRRSCAPVSEMHCLVLSPSDPESSI